MTPATKQKRSEFQQFIEKILVPETAVKGVVGIGSIATGHAKPDSDIDAVIFFDPLDPYIVPAEANWRAADDTFHSIFDEVAGSIQVDFARLDWAVWSQPDFDWPEGYKAEIGRGWIAYDPTGEVTAVIQVKTAYPDTLRRQRLDEAITCLDQHLGWGSPQENWDHLGPANAHDRLQAAYDCLVAGLFAYNRRWRIWRNREMNVLSQLAWLPDQYEDQIMIAANAPALDYEGYMVRVQVLAALFAALQAQVTSDGLYGPKPISDAFIRMHEEPGRAWNMDAWNEQRAARRAQTETE